MSLLTSRGLTIARGDRSIVRDVSFSVDRGDIVAVMGPSGAGKSTVLRAIAGLDPIAAGTVEIDGMTLAPGAVPRGMALRDLHRRVGVVFQFHHLFAHKRALENVWLAPVHVSRVSRADAERRAQDLLAHLGVGHRADAFPHELSGGEAQRVAIARALAMDPPLLLMDEPTASLDPERRGELAETLRQLAGQGRTLVVATHDVDFVRALAGRVIVLESGRLVRDGGVAEVF
ncbi:MAG: ATP-binding cassette domain-containing protein [Vicinamibacterales bacterium]